jgi:ATP-dependent DNA helicase RecG
VFIGQVSTFKGQWQLTNPTMALFGCPTTRHGRGRGRDQALFPLHPLTKGVESWDLQRAVAFALTILDEVPDPLPDALREAHGLPALDTALQWVHQPDTWEQVTSAQRRFRFDEALVTQLVLAGPGRAGAARWPGAQRWRVAGGLRRAAAVHAHPRAGGGVGRDRGRPRALPSDEPAAQGEVGSARPSSRCGRCSGW